MSIAGKRVIYLGDDEAYYRALLGEFTRHYASFAFRFERKFEHDPRKIQSLFLFIKEAMPAAVFIDFSKQPDDYVHLARLLSHAHHQFSFPIVGLHDYLSPQEQLKESFLTGITLNHVKSAEIFDVVYDTMMMLSPKDVREHGFATADTTEDSLALYPCKLGHVSPEGAHLETNLKLDAGAEYSMRHYWLAGKLIPSKKIKVKSTGIDLLFYHLNYQADIQFKLVDDPIVREGDTEADQRERTMEVEHERSKVRKKWKAWLEENLARSQRKVVRSLVLDHTYHLLHHQERIDKYDHIIRTQPYLLDIPDELTRQRPHMIAFSLIPPPADKTEEGKEVVVDKKPATKKAEVDIPENNIDMLIKICKVITHKFKDYRPFIIVFNCKTFDSQQLQSVLDYSQVMAYSGNLGIEILLKMTDMIKAKVLQEEAGLAVDPLTVYLRKSWPASLAEIEDPIIVTRINESDIVFQSSRDLPVGTSLRIETPFHCYLTVVHHPQYSKPGQYFGLINGVGEEEKKFLRRHINGLFFRDHDAAKQSEKDEFIKLNQTKLAEKTAAEEAAKQSQEDETPPTEEGPTDKLDE